MKWGLGNGSSVCKDPVVVGTNSKRVSVTYSSESRGCMDEAKLERKQDNLGRKDHYDLCPRAVTFVPEQWDIFNVSKNRHRMTSEGINRRS